MSGDGYGFLTPDHNGSANVECRTLALPSHLWMYFQGAMGELITESNWVQFGTMTPDECVSAFLDALDEMTECNMIGLIVPYATHNLPSNMLPCTGATYKRVDYPLLYAVIHSSLIVDADNFKTPDIAGRFLLSRKKGASFGSTGGEETHNLTVDEIPAHTHGYTPPVANVDIEGPVGVPDLIAAGVGLPSATDVQGGGQAHNNMPPYYVVNYGIIAK